MTAKAQLTVGAGLCHFRPVMLSERGRASGSFLLAVVAVVALVGGYVAYSLLRPDPYELSERVVRDSRRLLSAEVREFQRDVDGALRNGAGAERQVDEVTASALRDVDAVVDDARDQLAELDISLRTQRNRMERIDGRAREAREMIEEYAAEAKNKARDQAQQ
jgi:hypothetical protein